MRLTARLRVLVAFVVAVPVGWVYVVWGLQTGRNIFRVYGGGQSRCSDSYWHDLGNNCGRSFSVGLAWFELVLVGLIVLGIGWLLTHWALFPVRAMAGTVAKLGPTSLNVRLRATGPRDETRQLSDAIDELLNRVAVGYEAQRRFAANASHELRTPLATQRTLIEVSLADALTTLAKAAEERGVHIATDLAPAWVVGERPLLERLVSNLVQNAIKYNVDGGQVHVAVAQPGRLTVSNTGPLVAPDQIGGLFEPFRRQTGDRLDHGGGVGLGLTIARSIVAAHHGRIDAVANPGGGLTVDVALATNH